MNSRYIYKNQNYQSLRLNKIIMYIPQAGYSYSFMSENYSNDYRDQMAPIKALILFASLILITVLLTAYNDIVNTTFKRKAH